MIGVIADDPCRESVAEFFELFKTPWEWIVPGKPYPAVLIADGRTEPQAATLAIVCGASEHPVDHHLTCDRVGQSQVSKVWRVDDAHLRRLCDISRAGVG